MLGAFSEFALLLLISAAAGAVSLWLRQPVLIAYIVVGIVAGPAVFGIVTAHDQIDLLAQIGVAILLFVVGLKLDLQHIRHIGPVALATGLGQLTFTIIIGFAIILLLGKSMMEAIYVAVALTFSSTIIIVKLLSDKREIDSLHGRIAVGFLIVQDLAVVLAMMAMSALRGSDEAGMAEIAVSLVGRVVAAAVAIYLLMRYVLPKVVDLMARSQELLLVFAIAWGTGLAALGEWAGFSKEAGAFLAGFSLASTHYRDAINARLTGIRDFLLLFFFIDLGAKLDFSTLGEELWPAVILSLFVLIGNPLIVMAIMGYMGYRKRTGFLCGLTVAQISEFSIIFVAMGITLGHVGKEALGLTTLVGITTIALSTYMILYSHPLYEKLAPWLGWFERRRPFRELAVATERHDLKEADVIVFGLGRYGGRLALGLKEEGLKVLGVEFDPEVARAMRRHGLAVRYGDGVAAEFLESLPLAQTRWVVSTLPDIASNRSLLQALREHNFPGEVAIVAREDFEGVALKHLGAPTILYPMRNAVDYAVEALTDLIRPKENRP
ncbi:MAG: cation:proton antiporter [Rhodocyclaceae bacterium]|nr:cation:proton antiporter [Rhodocyclaceae bacterium]MDZ4214294.1 cation:proton antiporter family protein [Rhodocyclaceae bacterium]